MKFAAGSLSSLLVILPFFGSLAAAKPALSQPIAPAPDGTGTTVTPQGNTFNIQGGSLSRDGANLFHSFQKFGLSEGQTANFISNPDIRNILGRVVGGDASYINGLIRVSGGSSNLFLMNPAGILFGPNASLNVPADFTATTATGIGFGAGWFNAVGSNDYNILVGTPSAFNFAITQPGAIVNEGDLSLTAGSNLALLGGTVINTGTLTSPGGNISIAGVPGESTVRLSQEGHLLSLDIEPAALGKRTGVEPVPNENYEKLTPLSLPQLLTGGDFGHASRLTVNDRGEVSLTGSGVTIPTEAGIAAGNIDTSSPSGDGGAITLNATSDIITGSLRTAAGGTGTGGNITIVSSAGVINTIAGKLDASSVQGDGGNVTLTAERSIKTGEILSASGEITPTTNESGPEQFSYKGGTGRGGNITLESRSGAIDTSAGTLSSYSLERDGGSVTLSAFEDIKTGDIRSSSGYYDLNTRTGVGTGSGGEIALNSRAGGIDTALGGLDSSSTEGNGGSVTLRASGDIKTGEILSHGTGSGGNISLKSSAGGIDTAGGSLHSTSGEGNGGSVIMSASGDIKTGEILLYTGTGRGGNITLNSRAGGIDTAGGSLYSNSNQGNGGSVTLTASGDIQTAGIFAVSNGTGTGGKIALNSRAGAIDTTLGSLESSSRQGDGNSVTLTASGNIKTGYIQSFSGGAGTGGNIAINSSAGGIDTTLGEVNSSSRQGNAGSLNLTARDTAVTGKINSSGFLRGGDITITSELSDIINRGFLDLSSANGTPGNITFNAYAGSISAASFSSARNIAIASGGKDDPFSAGANASVTSDAGKINTLAGNVTLNAHSDITVSQPIKTSSISSLALNAGRSININADIDTSGSNGDIALRANHNSANPNYRDRGAGSVTMAPGTSLNAGSGNILIELGTLGQVGNITLSNINTAGALTVNAATGNILRSSADSLITAGSALFQTSILDTGGIGLLAEPLRINLRNLEVMAGSGGAFFDSPQGGVTVGGATDIPLGVLTSSGGDIWLRAAGDITITEPVSAASTMTGDAGNITLNSTAGAIDISASTLNSSSSQGNGGAVTLTAFGDIKTGALIKSSSGTGSGGNITFNSSAGGIDTAGGGLSSYSNQGNGGSVTLTASGDIKTSNIQSYSAGTGSGGNIALNSRAGGIDTASGTLSSSSSQGDGGSVTLTAFGDIKTDSIGSSSNGTGTGGNITLNSSAGGIDTAGGWLISSSEQGSGGSVTLTASGEIKTDNIWSYSNGTGSGGNIELKSSAGGIDIAGGQLSSYSTQGNAGSVTLTASGEIKTGQIASMGGFRGERMCSGTCGVSFTAVADSTGTGGDIKIESSNGGVETSAGSLNTMSSGGVAGSVTITAAGHVETANILSEGASKGGNISIRSDSSNSISVGGNLDTRSADGTAGNITLSSPGAITLTGNITSYGSTESGDITVTSASNNVRTNSIATQAGNGPSGNIAVNGNNIATGNLDSIGSLGAGNIQVRAGGSVTTLNIQSRTDAGNSGNIEVSAGGDINTGNQTSSTGEGDSGDINNTAGGDLTAGNQTTSATNGNSGNITNTASGNITAGNQTASATNGNAGSINNSAGGNVTAGNQTASATNGNAGNIDNSAGGNISTGSQTSSAQGGTAGNLTNTAGGNINTGNLTSTGTSGSGDINLTSASGQINTGEVRTDTGEVNISGGVNPVPVPVAAPRNPVPVPSLTQTEPVLSSLNHSVSYDSSINPNVSGRPTPTPSNNQSATSSSTQQLLASLNVGSSSPLALNSTEAIAQLEQTRGREFANYFGENLSSQLAPAESIRDALATIASQTGNRSAIIYVSALPDQLEVIVLTPEGKSVRQTVPAAKKEELLKAVREFRAEVTDVRKRRTASYLKPAQRLYQWLIAPIEPELQAAKIDTLLFSMDAGLRGLPVAALHDGKQFLVEKYSLALIPSVSLMDTRYQPLQGKQVLAMGASEFPDKQPLPAVPVELSEITQRLWQGKAFLNQDFTRNKLIGERNSYPYPIIHLATHGAFQPGDMSHSYIQLWDDKLRLDELRKLRLNSPPVELLVLSACRTAVGDEKAELGFAGFAVAAGVKTAVASLWYVSDAGTLGLMTEFYRHLADAKIKAEALRQAQLAMIRGEVRIEGGVLQGSKELRGVPLPAELVKEGSHNLKHPYYWSGFTMIGSPW